MPHVRWIVGVAGALLLTLPMGAAAQAPPAQAPPAAPAAAYTEAQLHDFARATLELDELTRGLGENPTEAQRQQATEAAHAVLQRHNLDVATFNAIANQASTDEALAQRIRTMRANPD